MLVLRLLLLSVASPGPSDPVPTQAPLETLGAARMVRHRDWEDPRQTRTFVVGTSDTIALARWLAARSWKSSNLGSGLFEVDLPTESLEELAALPGIERVESPPRRVRHALDPSRQRIQADPVHKGIGLSRAHRGTGALVGIIDIGFDLNHYAFLDSLGRSRILRVWDMTNTTGKPPSGFSTGTLFSTAQGIRDLGRTGSVSNHGTHVAGLAAGREWGAAGSWWGVADDARIALVDCGEGCKRLNDAIRYLFQLGDSLGLPVAVNMSWGTLNGPRNGTSSDCIQAKALVGPGKILVASAGNSGGGKGHASHVFAGDTVRFALEVSPGTQTLSTGQVRSVFFNEVEFWGDSAMPYKAWVEVLDAADSVLARTAPLAVGSLRSAWVNVDDRVVFGNDTVWTVGNLERRSGQGGLRLSVSTNRSSTQLRMVVAAAAGTVHGWIWEEGLEFASPGGARCPACVVPDNVNTISDKATCPAVVSVAATTGWTGNVASFSSRGPGLAKVAKPDVSAPGVEVVSALNSGGPAATVTASSGSFAWGPMSGTSMSAPLVTGTVALLLEQSPKMIADSVLALMKRDGARHSPDTGWAGLDVLKLFQRMDQVSASVSASRPLGRGPAKRTWITPDGRRIAVPAGARSADFHPGGIAWLQECLDGNCTSRGVIGR